MPNAESGVFAILFWGVGGEKREGEGEWEERGEGEEGEERGERGKREVGCAGVRF